MKCFGYVLAIDKHQQFFENCIGNSHQKWQDKRKVTESSMN